MREDEATDATDVPAMAGAIVRGIAPAIKVAAVVIAWAFYMGSTYTSARNSLDDLRTQVASLATALQVDRAERQAQRDQLVDHEHRLRRLEGPAPPR